MLRTIRLGLLLPLVLSCVVFDEDLYLEADAAEDSGGEEEGDLDLENLFVDECSADQLDMISDSVSLSLDLSQFTSVGLGYPKCVEKQYQGPDTFFVLDAKAGERWNVNAAPQNVDQDVAIVVLGDQCSATGCQAVRDRCGSGFDEDFALLAEEDRRFTVSIDSLDPDVTGKITLSLDKSICGNGIVEAGESCDGGPACDLQCRRVISGGTVAEGEPNDIFTGVDVIDVGAEGGRATITGSVGGPCDEDHYAILVPEGASLSVEMTGPGGAPCDEDTPAIALPLVDFLAPGGPVAVGEGKAVDGVGGCPGFDDRGLDPDFDFARNMKGSEYHLIINAFETDAAIPYEIHFDLQVDTAE